MLGRIRKIIKGVVKVPEVRVKNFVIVQEFCNYCPYLTIGKVLAQADIDLIDVKSGDPRIKALESQMGRMTKSKIPIGIVDGYLINYSRDSQFMYKLFGGV